MSVRKLYNGNYQTKLKGPDGRYWTRVFQTKGEAETQDRIWKEQKREGTLGTTIERQMTVGDFFARWHKDLRDATTLEEETGWRDLQAQIFRDYIHPVIGAVRLKNVTPQMIKGVLNEMAKKGRGKQTRRHAFGIMRKMFADAIEDYQYLTFNPVLKKLKPDVPIVEAPHLKHVDQMKRLLSAVEGKHFELAVWIQLFAGLRIGEVQALCWEDVDLEAGTLSVKRTFVRKRNTVRPYPKGKKQFTLALPPELWEKLKMAKGQSANQNEFVVKSLCGTMLQYKSYLKALKAICRDLRFSPLGTHVFDTQPPRFTCNMAQVRTICGNSFRILRVQ
jgi:integrase